MSDYIQSICDSYTQNPRAMTWMIVGGAGMGKMDTVRLIAQKLLGQQGMASGFKVLECGLTEEAKKKIQKEILEGRSVETTSDEGILIATGCSFCSIDHSSILKSSSLFVGARKTIFGMLIISGISKIPRWVISAPHIVDIVIKIVAGALFSAKSCESWSYALCIKELATDKTGLAPPFARPEI